MKHVIVREQRSNILVNELLTQSASIDHYNRISPIWTNRREISYEGNFVPLNVNPKWIINFMADRTAQLVQTSASPAGLSFDGCEGRNDLVGL